MVRMFPALLAEVTATHAGRDPVAIDLTGTLPLATRGHLGLGATERPDGCTLDADSISLYRDGLPWLPVMGEFHYSRYPADEWRDELLKMRAGGIEVVATYVFWIHHEEARGDYDWAGQRSLRGFLQLCRDVGLLAVIRMGPWCHGEVRNGGFPDWVQNAEFWAGEGASRERTARPEFLALVEPFYGQIAEQMRGLLWKDGGPVIGVQLDNECRDVAYLLALKGLARSLGIDVPLYTMTGWGPAPVPDEGLLPIFGGYPDGFWSDDEVSFRKLLLFSPIRDDGDMGTVDGRLGNIRPDRQRALDRFPYGCCEIGGGQPSSYDRRIRPTPEDTAALAVVKLGSGNNLCGYYVFHGGVNPDGQLTTLDETKASGYPNDLPIKDYDFGAPLGACGQMREHYHLLRQQHFFLRDFGADLARMHAFFPEETPRDLDDTDTLRWSVRWDGRRGYLFHSNHQRGLPLPAKEGVRFRLRTSEGAVVLPEEPLTIPSGSYGFWPVNLDCAGVSVDYATAQPVCQVAADDAHWFFFAALEGIPAEFRVSGVVLSGIEPGTGIAFTRASADGRPVHFVVLPPAQARTLWRFRLAGRERVLLCPNALIPTAEDELRLEAWSGDEVALAVFPALSDVRIDGELACAEDDGIFERLAIGPQPDEPGAVSFRQARKAKTGAGVGHPMDDAAWTAAAVWRLGLPPGTELDTILRVRYMGDVARIYAGEHLVLDDFFNGTPFDVALWRIPRHEWDAIEVRIMPLSPDAAARLPSEWGARPGAELLEVTALRKSVVAARFGKGDR